MTLSPPEYFMRIQDEARKRWDQLEADPALAGPWRQLFRQVQSLRHVLSELLQNADDAGATWVKTRINNGVFEFIHNGEDFNEETFRSLCQFGLSNKRHLHTIGFRGVGFKSVFSLGPRVEIFTPTLAFAYDHNRFTEPTWIKTSRFYEFTNFQIRIDNESKLDFLMAELKRWQESPIPLLFFQNILNLDVQDLPIEKKIVGKGPVPDSEYVRITNPEIDEILCFRSKPEDFPKEAVDEIREERGSTDILLPPISVQVVLDSSFTQRLYTVLPTDVMPKVPFSFNGPFIQDPSRKEIKHPINSPTNSWLLKKIGRLAADTMEKWLKNSNLPLGDRALAYSLMPWPIVADGSLAHESTKIILEGFFERISEDAELLLCFDGSLSNKQNTIALPDAILDTWGAKEALTIFSPGKDKAIAREVTKKTRQKLSRWNLLKIIEREDVYNELLKRSTQGIASPTNLECLVYLWSYLHPLIRDWTLRSNLEKLPIVPISGRKKLYPAEKALSVGGKESRILEDDWKFLMGKIDIVDPNWNRFINSSISDVIDDVELNKKKLNQAKELFNELKLHQKVGLEQLIAAVSDRVFGYEDPGAEGIQIAHIAARGNVTIPKSFKYLCQDDCWRSANTELIIEGKEDLLSLFPYSWLKSQLISASYEKDMDIHNRNIWLQWSRDGSKSKLLGFPMPLRKLENKRYFGKRNCEKFCKERGGKAPTQFHLKSDYFIINDHDWDESLWSLWIERADEDSQTWKRLGSAIIVNWSNEWSNRQQAKLRQVGRTYTYPVDHGRLNAAWLHKLKNLPCLPDNFGRPSIPAELCRMTPDTRPLYNIERFVHPDFDKPEYENILDLLGVRSQAKSIEPLLNRLRDLSRTDSPPITHIVDLYRAIDQVLLRMDSESANELRDIFKKESIIYTDDEGWESLENVFHDNPENIPGVKIIHPEARNLAMWDRLEIIKRPTLEMAIEWLKKIPLGDMLNRSDKSRVAQILKSAPETVWQKCNAWIDASGKWTEQRNFKWRVSERRITYDLFDSIKMCTSDFSILGSSASEFCKKVGLIQLEFALEQRLKRFIPAITSSKPSWIGALGNTLDRLRYPDKGSDLEKIKSQVEEDKRMGTRLSNSGWQPVLELVMVPYLDNQPAGTERASKVVWHDGTIYIEGEAPSHHRELVGEISRHFQTSEAKRAVIDCIDRDSSWIAAYANEHLDLEDEGELPEIEIDELDQEKIELKDIYRDVHEDDSGIIEKVDLGEISEEAEQTLEEFDIDMVDEENYQETHRTKKPRQVKLKDIFANYLSESGFEWSESRNCFIHPDGTLIRRANPPFHWVAYNNGTETARYWIVRGSIEQGFEIPSEIWSWPVSTDSQIYLLLVESKNILVVQSLSRLQEKAKSGEIELYATKLIVRTKSKE